MSTTSAPAKTLTYEQALKAGRKVGASHAGDASLMALLCEDPLQTLVGAVAPQLVWEGAQKVGLTTKELLALCNSNPIAVGELMWVENAEDFDAVLAHLDGTSTADEAVQSEAPQDDAPELTATVLSREWSIALDVTGAPTLTNQNCSVTITPSTVQITYRQEATYHRIRVTGCPTRPAGKRNSKSTSASVAFLPGEDLPEWLASLVTRNTPA